MTSGLAAASEVTREPVRLIFDTDIGSDVDDAMALSTIHALVNSAYVGPRRVTATCVHCPKGTESGAETNGYAKPHASSNRTAGFTSLRRRQIVGLDLRQRAT